jgi:hypothetical protein
LVQLLREEAVALVLVSFVFVYHVLIHSCCLIVVLRVFDTNSSDSWGEWWKFW